MTKIPDGWIVIYTYNGVEAKFITLDKFSADDFAVRYHGIVYPVDRREPK